MEMYILGINFFFPTFNTILGSSLGSIILNIILILLSFFKIVIIKEKKISKLLISIIIYYFIMISISLFLNTSTNNIKDFFEYSRPVLMLFSLILGYNYYSLKKTKKFKKEINIIFNIFIFINLLKFFYPQLILFKFYQRDYLAERVRLSGTFISPYDYAYFLILPFFYYFDLYLKNKKILFLFKMTMFFISILLTQSRSQLLTVLFGIFIYSIIKIFFLKENIKEFIKIFISFSFMLFYSLIKYK
ncbi:MAG: hypothetical protein ACRC4S_01285, partial [Cetobacterium sp.]